MTAHKKNTKKPVKKATKANQRRDHERHLLHHIIVELSFTGTVARSFLVGLLAITILIAQLFVFYGQSGPTSLIVGNRLEDYLLPSLQNFVMLLFGFIVFDLLYIFVRRLYILPSWIDRILLVMIEIGFVAVLVLPIFVQINWAANIHNTMFLLVSPIFVLGVRVLLGVAARQHRLVE